ncbi:(2,3-dihydroxybenzoyl)adenylate synthase [Amycolatopsis pithecellobii]|uniref:AMP-binding protein n=1 Tax=Amycolatopsis pithecellobii TaxID=664692 RepID=A0A6N7Z0R4_9PSEU|nr:AMP-binding protein [Amycolatopsis pithecellobii]MTD53064.1 AMP-binding protein [Amycolatopsis pithecellobii]
MTTASSKLVSFPPDVVAGYLASGAWHSEPLARCFRRVAEREKGREALVCGGVRLTYAELDRLSDQRAAGLHALGLPVGGAVLLQLHNTAETVVTWYALLKAGLVPVCTLPLHRRHEISEIGRQTEPVAHIVEAANPGFDLVGFAKETAAQAQRPWRVLVSGPIPADTADVVSVSDLGNDIDAKEARRLVESIQDGLAPHDVAVYQLSGGTTGVPKVIPRLHGEYWYNAERYAAVLEWDRNDRVAYIAPVMHNAGVVCGIHGPHSVGATAILGVPSLEPLYGLLAGEAATDIVLGPFAYEAASDERLAEAAALKRVIFSGKKVPGHHFAALQERGIWAGQLFGMGEGLCMTTPLDAPAQVRATTVGIPISEHDEVRILEPGTENDLPDGTVGELCVRGPYTIRGYYDAPEHNERAFTSDGFYRTGDLAMATTIEGVRCFTIEGRIKDLINRGGEKINAEEIELLLVSHPDIMEAALVAMPDTRLGERACAYVVGRAGVRHDLATMRAYFEDLGVAKYKWPERIVWLDEMPRASQVGKIDKKLLRKYARSETPEV